MLVAGMTRIHSMQKQKHENQKVQDTIAKIQENAFTQWCNLFFKSKGFEIDNLSALHDGTFVIVLLEIVSGKNLYADETELDGKTEEERTWSLIIHSLEEENIQVPANPGEFICLVTF